MCRVRTPYGKVALLDLTQVCTRDPTSDCIPRISFGDVVGAFDEIAIRLKEGERCATADFGQRNGCGAGFEPQCCMPTGDALAVG